MLAVEIVLILIGVAFLVGSYFIEERFSEKDLKEISKMSETQLNIIVEKQVNEARTQVENSVEEIIDESLAITQRGLEKETNQKIMAISEYADTVLENMNKTHNEIMFLYSMLNDKHADITELAGTLQEHTRQVNAEPKEADVSKSEGKLSSENDTEQQRVTSVTAATEEINQGDADAMQENGYANKNEQILQMHKAGRSDVEIAKTLDCGLGEVRLVLGLYKEERE